MTLSWAIVIFLYIAGSICALGVSSLLVMMGGRSPRPREFGWIMLWVMFWPILSPFFIVHVLVKLFRK
jgi:hypothetical protein